MQSPFPLLFDAHDSLKDILYLNLFCICRQYVFSSV